MKTLKDILDELALILRGEHKSWEGDRRANGYHYITQIADDYPEHAEELGLELAKDLRTHAEVSGISPGTLTLVAKLLQGARQGSL